MAERPDETRGAARVVIAGGGIAALEAVLALRDLAPTRTHLTVVAPDPEFLYKPLTVEEPFTGEPAEHHELEPLLYELGARFVSASVQSVDAAAHSVGLDSGHHLHYDFLVICVGGHARPAYSVAETFWSSRWDLPVDHLIEQAAASGEKTMAFVVPPGCSWPLPLYELALMTRRRTEELGKSRLRLELYTRERAPLELFGVPASDAVAALLTARKIDFRPGASVTEDAGGALHAAPEGATIHARAVVALPEIAGPAIDGLPADEHGFIPVDGYGRVTDVEDVYAAGDATDFPVKQGGLATQQADAAVEDLAARLGAHIDPTPFHPVLRGQLITGAESLNLKHDPAAGPGQGVASLDYLWWPPQKIRGRYLSAWLGHVSPRRDVEPPFLPLEVAVSWPHEWHGDPVPFDAEAPRI